MLMNFLLVQHFLFVMTPVGCFRIEHIGQISNTWEFSVYLNPPFPFHFNFFLHGPPSTSRACTAFTKYIKMTSEKTSSPWADNPGS